MNDSHRALNATNMRAKVAGALEFANNVAKGAEGLVNAVKESDRLRRRIEEGEDIDEAMLSRANESVVRCARGLRSTLDGHRETSGRGDPSVEEISGPPLDPRNLAPAPVAREIPDYAPAPQRGQEIVTYWLWYGGECVGSKRLPVGTGAVDVRNAALNDAFILCDRSNGETPHERASKIRAATVKVYDDRSIQEAFRREMPFEFRGLFPNELPFLELTYRSPLSGPDARVHLGDVTVGLQNIGLAEGLELTCNVGGDFERTIRIESSDRVALGRVDLAMKAYLLERDASIVSEFGVGFVRVEEPCTPTEAEDETERPRG